MARRNAVARIDDLILRLERLYREAQNIFDDHIDELIRDDPTKSFGTAKYQLLAIPAGSAINHIAGLKLVRERLTDKQSEVLKYSRAMPDPIRISFADEAEVGALLIEHGLFAGEDRPSMARAVSTILDVLALDARRPISDMRV